MASRKDLKQIALLRVKSAKLLLDGRDWQGAAYMMGLSLECLLKAAVCKTLRIEDFPENHKDDKVPPFFMNHSFVRLQLLSGLSDIFSATGDVAAFGNWSDFTIKYPSEWIYIRYASPANSPFDEATTKKLFQYLYESPNSIVKTVIKRKRC
jgi:hypothetical protein